MDIMNLPPLQTGSKYYDYRGSEIKTPGIWKFQDDMQKECRDCHTLKPLSEYHASQSTTDDRRSDCKDCSNKKRRKQYHSSDKFKYHTADGKMTPALANAKYRAKKKGLEFDITRDYIISLWNEQDGRCKITNEKFKLDSNSKYSKDGAHLDRIDSSKGYVKGNVQWIIGWVNLMKSSYDMEDFKTKITIVYKSLNT